MMPSFQALQHASSPKPNPSASISMSTPLDFKMPPRLLIIPASLSALRPQRLHRPPPATRALSFDCLCLHPNTSAGSDITPNCTTSSFNINNEPPTPSPTLPPSQTPVTQTPVTTVIPRVSSSNSNSAGVLAGSVIGALVGTLLLLIAAMLLWRRSRATRDRAGKAKITRSAFASYGELNTDHSSNLDDKHQVHPPSYRS